MMTRWNINIEAAPIRWSSSRRVRNTGKGRGKKGCGVDKPGTGERLGGAALKNPYGGGPKCMLGRRDTGRNESHGVGNRIYRVLRSCITIPGEFTARSRALGKNRWGAPLENIGRDFEPRIRSDFRTDLLVSWYFEKGGYVQSVQCIPFSII